MKNHALCLKLLLFSFFWGGFGGLHYCRKFILAENPLLEIIDNGGGEHIMTGNLDWGKYHPRILGC